jgi:hypothetical protein
MFNRRFNTTRQIIKIPRNLILSLKGKTLIFAKLVFKNIQLSFSKSIYNLNLALFRQMKTISLAKKYQQITLKHYFNFLNEVYNSLQTLRSRVEMIKYNCLNNT